MLRLDDIINKKKESSQILDLSRVKIKTKEEFEKYFDKVPEFKIRPEKVRTDDAAMRDSDFSFVSSRKETKSRMKREFVYSDPIPPSMRSVRIEDLAAVEINWRMLTVCRPKNRLEEDFFSRIVQLAKLQLTTAKHEAKLLASAAHGLPSAQAHLSSLGIVTTKSKRGTRETRIKTCKECGEELCSGKYCKDFPYESYTRMIMDKEDLAKDEAEELGLSKPRRNSTKPGGKGGSKVKQPRGKLLKRRKKRKKKKGKDGTQEQGKGNDEAGSP